jgi:hypothetical protein
MCTPFRPDPLLVSELWNSNPRLHASSAVPGVCSRSFLWCRQRDGVEVYAACMLLVGRNFNCQHPPQERAVVPETRVYITAAPMPGCQLQKYSSANKEISRNSTAIKNFTQ